jgi:hypothetical protein
MVGSLEELVKCVENKALLDATISLIMSRNSLTIFVEYAAVSRLAGFVMKPHSSQHVVLHKQSPISVVNIH